MKKLFTFSCLLLFISFTSFAQLKIGAPAGAANSSAILDLNASAANKGLLMPSVALTSTTSFAPLAAHVAGMLVYNTATVSDVVPGLYINNGTKWTKVVATTADALYSALSTSQAAYASAGVDTWVPITAAEYANILATVSSAASYGGPDALFAGAGSGGNFGVGATTGINSGSGTTVPASSYPIAMKWMSYRGGAAGTASGVTCQLKFGASPSNTYNNYIGITPSVSTVSGTANYFVIRQPSTALASIGYVGLYLGVVPVGLSGTANNGVTLYLVSGNLANGGNLTGSDTNGYQPCIQVLATPNKTW